MTEPIKAEVDGVKIEISDELISKYDRPLPRYTSYPPAPAWSAKGVEEYSRAFREIAGLEVCLYVHIPFCDTKCTFCGCNSIATSNREIIERYTSACISEIRLCQDRLGKTTKISQTHFGGGTPAAAGMDGLARIVREMRDRFEFSDRAEIGIEIDPRAVMPDDIEKMAAIGFNRTSFGVQDFDPSVGSGIGRVSDPAKVESLIGAARAAGMSGINFDLVYGLPRQTLASWNATLEKVIGQRPDRVAVFNFAYLPKLLPHQRKLDAGALPSPREKLALFLSSIEKFQASGYEYIGLDHFVRAGDALANAHKNGNLTRNFQGYAVGAGIPLLGLGSTAISEIGNTYVQNEHRLIRYIEKVESGTFATVKGMTLSRDDLIRRFVIRRLMCSQRLDKTEFAKVWGVEFDKYFADIPAKLSSLIDDGFVRISSTAIEITALGRIFVRAAAAAFDATLDSKATKYSRGV